MELKIYQVDAFTGELFGGNPAAVCPLENWIDEKLMQSIANENNLSETAFFVKRNDDFEIRWFTPAVEVDLCGHATLASGFVLFNILKYDKNVIHFSSKSGILSVRKNGEKLTLDFPADTLAETGLGNEISAALGIKPLKVLKGRSDILVVLSSQAEVEKLDPEFAKLKKIAARGIIVTAPGIETDFVSRFFAPQSGINEDPVTGSAHTTLTPYWAAELNKTEMTALQLSKRRGSLNCRINGGRVEISGMARLYMEGKIYTE